MDTGAAGHPDDNLRVSDADRDQVLSELSEHFQAGRLTAEEFDERSGRALRARTRKDLADLFADLPPSKVAVPETAVTPADAGPRQPARLPARLLPVRVGILAVAIAWLLGGRFEPRFWILIAVVLVIALCLGRGGPRDRRHRERL
jgi:Domain of unknown function (DUF1707)